MFIANNKHLIVNIYLALIICLIYFGYLVKGIILNYDNSINGVIPYYR